MTSTVRLRQLRRHVKRTTRSEFQPSPVARMRSAQAAAPPASVRRDPAQDRRLIAQAIGHADAWALSATTAGEFRRGVAALAAGEPLPFPAPADPARTEALYIAAAALAEAADRRYSPDAYEAAKTILVGAAAAHGRYARLRQPTKGAAR